MDTLSPYFGEETNYMRSSDKEEEEMDEEDEGGNGCEEIKEDEKGMMNAVKSRFHCFQTRMRQNFMLTVSMSERLTRGHSDESAIQEQQRPAWTPRLGFFAKAEKEVHYFVGQEIIIEEGFDSYAGMIWPAVSITSFATIWHEVRVHVSTIFMALFSIAIKFYSKVV